MARNQAKTQANDITDAVNAITASFYDDGRQDLALGTGGRSNDMPGREMRRDDVPPRMAHYVQFSNSHKGSGNILVGVMLFFFLILAVWGVLWYQSVRQINLTESFEYDIFDTSSGELSALFENIQADAEEQASLTTEADLKSELSTILAGQQTQVLGVTTTTTTTTKTKE